MLIVSFDIATDLMHIAVEKDDQIIALHQDVSTKEKYNSALVIPSMVKIFEEHKINPSNIDAISVNAGPGSFTGIRAAAVIARTLGQFLNIPVIGLSSLEIYANAVDSTKEKYVIIDARRSKCYTGLYSADNNEIQPPSLIPNNTVMEIINSHEYQLITEKNLSEWLKDFSPVYISDIEKNLGIILTGLAKKKLAVATNAKKKFAWYNLEPIYLQTPSITISKKISHMTQ